METAVKNQVCALCQEIKPLRLSHIIPAFVFRWLRDSSGGGYLRFGANPNKRTQDGFKIDLLCANCEQNLNKWETLFANKIFFPYMLDANQTFNYNDYLACFCVSISWRSLQYFMQDIEYNSIIKEFKDDIVTASDRWRNFLLSKSPHPGRFEQHLLPVDAIESANGLNAPININRYLMRSVEIDMVKSNHSLMIYAKMGRFILFGYIIPPSSKWLGTKVSINCGVIKPREYTLPYGLMNFLFDRANNMEKFSESISDRQKDISDKQLEKNFDKFSRSDHMRAMMADYELFGESAVIRSKK